METTKMGSRLGKISEQMIWRCIAVTCSTSSWAKAVENELEILQRQGKIHKETVIIVVEDPVPNVGSGGATLNALLVIAEKLSVKLKHQIISSDFLLDSRVLILHQGRRYPFDVCSKAFVTLPQIKPGTLNSKTLTTNLEKLLDVVQKLQIGSGPGLWVCSTDMVLLLNDTERFNFDGNPDGIMVCIPADIEWAVDHGTAVIDEQGYVENILYGAAKEQLINVSSNKKTVPVICGIIYLSPSVAETMLSFYELSPLDCCTYMGVDSGAEYLRVSLVFDILLAMSTGLSEEEFKSGNCGKAYNKKLNYKFDAEMKLSIQYGRSRVWEYLHKFKLKAKICETGLHNYWAENGNFESHMKTFGTVASYGQYHSICQTPVGLPATILNSSLPPTCAIGKDSLIQHSAIHGNFIIGERCFISDANIVIDSKRDSFALKDDLCLLNIPAKIRNCDTIPTYFLLLIGNQDRLQLSETDPLATYCNKKWKTFFSHTGIKSDDVWAEELLPEERSLFTAKLFPILQNYDIISWFQTNSADVKLLERWKSEPKASFKDIMEALDPVAALDYRREIYGNVTCEIIQSILLNDKECSLTSYFERACAEGWPRKILNCLDNVAQQVIAHPQSCSGNLKRILFAIADLLGCMGGNSAGMRSGPAGNKTWDAAFNSLRERKFTEAFKYMSNIRSQWLEKPELMLRAARHYEKAASIIIHTDVDTAAKFVQVKDGELVPMGTWITCDIPARIDVLGGWTDTPPQCYELEGSVIDIAVNLFSKKPIGARGRRIKPFEIELVLHAEGGLQKNVCLKKMDDIMDFNRPNAPAALLKAAIISTGIIDLRSENNLEIQLKKKLQSGFELHSWANVPQGSGLGTSSILAAALSSTLWTLAGKSYNRSDIYHNVLVIEQLMTTAGGWQDVVSGVTGGVCRGYSNKGLPLQVNVERINLSEQHLNLLNKHLVLIYTGKVRLARNIVQNTIRNWYARDPLVVNSLREMNAKQKDFIEALHSGNLQKLGELMNRYWELKKVVAPGCEPVIVKTMMDFLNPYVYGQSLAGAGGGGFWFALSKKPNSFEFINDLLKNEGYVNAKVYDSSINTEGITMKIGEEIVEIPHKLT